MPVVALIASHRREFDGILRRVGSGQVLPLGLHFARAFHRHLSGLGETRWLLLADGIGAAAATRACAAIPQPATLDAIFSVGHCGATRPAWRHGDVLTASQLTHDASGETFPCIPATSSTRPVSPAALLTVDHIVRFAAEKHHIGVRGFDAVEMEAAAVARFARQHRIPFLVLKSVSDTCEEDLPIDLERARRPGGGLRIHSVLAQALSRPWTGIPGLRRLAHAAHLASDSLGEAILGISW